VSGRNRHNRARLSVAAVRGCLRPHRRPIHQPWLRGARHGHRRRTLGRPQAPVPLNRL